MDSLEDQIFADFQAEAVEDIFRVKKELLVLRRAVTPLRDVFNTLLRREQPMFSRETHTYFQDVFDHLIRVADTIDTLRDMIGSMMDAYLSISGNRMNMIMKRLTSISTILMSVTFVAGIYGMNFDYMPELKWRYGYVGHSIYGRCGSGDLFLLSKDQMAMRQSGHEDRREDGLDFRETEKSRPSRSREEKSALDDTQEAGDSSRVVLVIVALALVFISIITYFVAQMPRKP